MDQELRKIVLGVFAVIYLISAAPLKSFAVFEDTEKIAFKTELETIKKENAKLKIFDFRLY